MDEQIGKKIGNINKLNGTDLLMLKRFLEKGMRSGLFQDTEKQSVILLRAKLDFILKSILADDSEN